MKYLILIFFFSCHKQAIIPDPPTAKTPVIEPIVEPIKYYSGVAIDDGRYNSFGNIIEPGLMVYRSGINHLNGGEIRTAKYKDGVWSSPRTLFTPADREDYRDPRIGLVGSDSIIFTSRMNSKGFIDMGYFMSGAGGWSKYNKLPFPAGVDRAITYGKIISFKGKQYAAAYGFNNAMTTFQMWLWEIGSFSAIPVYKGIEVKITESSMEATPEGLIIVSRAEGTNRLYQFTSTDAVNWSKPQMTSIGQTNNINTSVPDLFQYNGRLYLSYMDRAEGKIKLCNTTSSEVFSNPNAWTSQPYADNKNLGYPSACAINKQTWLIVWSSEVTQSNTQIFFKTN